MGNLGLEEYVFEEAPPPSNGASSGAVIDNDAHFARQNGTHPESPFLEVPFRYTSGKPAKPPPLVIE